MKIKILWDVNGVYHIDEKYGKEFEVDDSVAEDLLSMHLQSHQLLDKVQRKLAKIYGNS